MQPSVFLIIPDATLLDISGPYEVFAQTMEYIQANSPPTGYRYELHSLSVSKKKSVRTSAGLVVKCEEELSDCNYRVDTHLTLKEIALLCGLGSPDNMRKIFLKYIQTSPVAYRQHFQGQG